MNNREHATIEAVRLETYETLRDGVTLLSVGGRLGGLPATLTLKDWHCCVLGTRLALDVLREHLIFGRALKVQVLAFTEAAWELEKQGIHPWALDQDGNVLVRSDAAGKRIGVFPCGFRDGGYQTDQTEEGWLNGHVVAVIENEVLLDTTAVQFSHLDYGLLVEPLAVDLANDPGRDWIANPRDTFLCVELPDGGALLYRESPDLGGLYDASDWRDATLEIRAAAQAINRAVKERLS